MNFFSSSQQIALICYFPLEVNGGRFLSLLVTLRNTATHRHSKIKQNKSTTKQKQEFSGKHFQNKHQSLTSPASIRLAPGADRVVRHICIRCICCSRNSAKKKTEHFNVNQMLVMPSVYDVESLCTCTSQIIYISDVNIIK